MSVNKNGFAFKQWIRLKAPKWNVFFLSHSLPFWKLCHIFYNIVAVATAIDMFDAKCFTSLVKFVYLQNESEIIGDKGSEFDDGKKDNKKLFPLNFCVAREVNMKLFEHSVWKVPISFYAIKILIL